jgi:peptidoglycan/LPS O-acetylase OafA/YrhL
MGTETAFVADTEVGTGEPQSVSTYRPHLDGLRAVAVYLVVAFHAGSKPFSGGYIGVDIFFVLSGYLVTQLLLRDIVGQGAISFGRFYSRRFRRLLPAAFVVLIVTAAVYSAIATPSQVLGSVGSFKAAFLYSTNWYLVHQAAGYFGADISANPVLHFWSLAVEEQFYLLWPIVLALVFGITRRLDLARQLRIVRIVVGLGALASVVLALSLRTSNPNHAYYGTDTRAYELLAGALIALSPELLSSLRRFARSMRVATMASIAVLFLLSSSWVNFDAIQRGVAVTIATGALLVALESSTGGVVERALSTRTMMFLGKISYGTYLWHWIVILVLLTEFHVSSIAAIGIAALVATALAALSFDLLEHPVRAARRLDSYRRGVIATGLALSLVGALVVIPDILRRPSSPAALAWTPATGMTPVPEGLDWAKVLSEKRPTPDCFEKPIEHCEVVHGTGTTVALVGDSHAEMLLPAFIAVAQRRHWRLVVDTRDACPWQAGLYRFTDKACLKYKADLESRVIPHFDPKVVILVHAPLDKSGVKGLFLRGPDGQLTLGTSRAERAIETGADQTIARLRRAGRNVVIMEPIPQWPRKSNPLSCLSKAKYLEECRFVTEAKPAALELHYRALRRADSHVWSVDIDSLVCPYKPICDPVVRGHIAWYDLSHLSLDFAATLTDPIATYFADNRIDSG